MASENRNIRPATAPDIPAILPVLDAARRIMRESGNPNQWADGYPSADALRKACFRYCGIIYLANGDERLAYQLLVK